MISVFDALWLGDRLGRSMESLIFRELFERPEVPGHWQSDFKLVEF